MLHSSRFQKEKFPRGILERVWKAHGSLFQRHSGPQAAEIIRTCKRLLPNITQFRQISPTKGDCRGDGFGSAWLPHSRYLRVSRMLIQTWFFSLPLAAVLECAPRRYEPPTKERVVTYWNKLPTSVVTAASVKTCKKRLQKVWTEGFPHLPHWLSSHLANHLTSPSPRTAHHPLIVTSICYPNPCSVYVVSSGPFWPTVYYYKW